MKMLFTKVQSKVFNNYRNASSVREVAVVGLGLMGHGIAQISAHSGYNVIAVESNEKALVTGMQRIQTSLQKVIAKDIKKGVYTSEEHGQEAFHKIMQRIKPTTNIQSVANSDLVVEAIVENIAVKLDFYKHLSTVSTNPDCIFASNTSSLQITEMAIASKRPHNFVGLHFFNPVQIMKLVEVINTEKTSKETFDRVIEYVKTIGKVSVSCQDTPGFIVNRLLVPYIAQAMLMFDRQEASVKDIDVAMQLGAGHPMGPLQLADYVGLDTTLSILQGWKDSYPEEACFVIPKCLVSLVNDKRLGRKTGQGFYVWEGDKALHPVL